MKKLIAKLLGYMLIVCLFCIQSAHADRQGGGGIPIGIVPNSEMDLQNGMSKQLELRPIRLPDVILKVDNVNFPIQWISFKGIDSESITFNVGTSTGTKLQLTMDKETLSTQPNEVISALLESKTQAL